MKERFLKPCTIIPRKLYVQRSADRELRQVIADMGRPGYVLVARQMGKTNLLLQAKRELEDDKNIFVYLDLSNTYQTAQECFRAIIDAAVETHEVAFSNLAQAIEERRTRKLPPHKEHEIELRLLLRAITGKIVIILDEIDALTNADYSDQIFAQIRSIYFSRINFPEYERLTYILSGVAEPGEIIQNPKLSPFNIGQKIYLDDFSRGEFAQFISSADLGLSDSVANQVYSWTAGNPRMTWDICAELEVWLERKSLVSAETVDAIVADMYLSSFDRAPVDHIRTLVASDRDIGSAVVQIRYNKGSEISDALRSRLYLAGIIRADDPDSKIKNKIIDRSLSDQWLRDVERQHVGLLKLADGKLEGGEYAEAIRLYDELIASNGADEATLFRVYDSLGVAHYALGNYRETLRYVAISLVDKSQFPMVYCSQVHTLGVCHMLLREYEESISSFQKILDDGNQDSSIYFAAKMNLATAQYELDFEKHRESVMSAYESILALKAENYPRVGARKMDGYKVVAYEKFAAALVRLGNYDEARRQLRLAVETCSVSERPVLLMRLFEIEELPEERRTIVRRVCQEIIDGKLRPGKQLLHLEGVLLDAPALCDALVASFAVDFAGSFSELASYVLKQLGDDSGRRDVLKLLPRVIMRGEASRSAGLLLSLIDVGKKEGVSLEESVLFEFYRAQSYLTNSTEESFEFYFAFYKESRSFATLERLDFLVFARRILFLRRLGQDEELFELLDFLSEYRDTANEELRPSFVYVDNMQMYCHRDSGNLDLMRQAAQRILDGESTWRHDPVCVGIFKASGLSRMSANARAMMLLRHPNESRRINSSGDRIGRNDWVTVRYNDGSVAKKKYKKVAAELDSGVCELITES